MGDQSKKLIKTPLALFLSESQPRDLRLEGLGALHQSAERECHERWRIFSCVLLIACRCLCRYCRASSCAPNIAPCDLTAVRIGSAGSMSGQIILSQVARKSP